MPYFLYKIHRRAGLAALEYITRFDAFPEAKRRAREMRAELPADSDCTVKMVFADSEEAAADLLAEKREPPILREWEK